METTTAATGTGGKGAVPRSGPLLAAALVCAYKSTVLSAAITGSSAKLLPYLLAGDLLFLGVVAFLCALTGARNRLLSAGLVVLLIVLNAIYWVDTFVALTLNQRVTLQHVLNLLPDLPTILGFITPAHVLLFVPFVGLHLLGVPALGSRTLAVAGLALVLVGAYRHEVVPEHYRRYAFPQPSAFAAIDGRPSTTPRFDARQVAHYREELQAQPLVSLPQPGVNVVLVVIESLSASDSFKTSGLRNRLPRFDAMAEDGVLFVNFFANYGLSDGGVISLLGGSAPIPFPMISRALFLAFSFQESALRELKQMGYRTAVLSAVPLSFQRMDHYLKTADVDVAIGRDDHPVLRDAPRYVLDAPPDAVLYDFTLQTVDELAAAGQPFFLAVMTASSHGPPTDPRGRANTEDNVWEYVDGELARLYAGLRERQFFDDGVLIVTGDHRKHAALTEEERRRFGDSAEARIPLLVVGAGVPRGVVDRRFFQQADLMRKLGSVAEPGTPLSPAPVVVEIFTRGAHEYDQMGHLRFFSEADGGKEAHQAFVYGTSFQWLTSPPPDAAAVELRIQAERAVHQQNLTTIAGCEGSVPADDGPDAAQPGMLARHVTWGGEPTADAVARVLAERHVDHVAGLDARDLGFHLQAGDMVEYRGYLEVPRDGTYWFRADPLWQTCVRIDDLPVVNRTRGLLGWSDDSIYLTAGRHRISLMQVLPAVATKLSLLWRQPGEPTYTPVAPPALVSPRNAGGTRS